MDNRERLVVEVVYAMPDQQPTVTVVFEPGLTAGGAVELSGLIERYPEIKQHPLILGIFGERVAADRAVEAGDRVEICRPLRVDPRDMRRMLHASGRVMGEVRSRAAK
jgi:putative ubiquitin-RnfH superfamily antitoxin RatB of RatAB toxin-antitoxin module